MSKDRANAREVRERARQVTESLSALANEAVGVDPALSARVDAALRALRASAKPPSNAALLENPADARALVRDVVAEELQRFWERQGRM